MTRRRHLWAALALLCFFLCKHNASAWSLKSTKLAQSISTGYQQRVAADPSFAQKSVTELLLAAGTQMTAEWNRRGTAGLNNEIDFVVAGVLTACYGKFYSMWRVAPTKISKSQSSAGDTPTDATVFGIAVPTNAFQPTMLDGKTLPTLQQRMLSLLAPVPALFKAGCIASLVGYGLTALFIALRSILVPSYMAATRNVNIIYASLYTGAFMAVVSNLRYQILQGIIEPKLVDRYLKGYPALRAATMFMVRLANGLLGSTLAIVGMKTLGLQQLKS